MLIVYRIECLGDLLPLFFSRDKLDDIRIFIEENFLA